MRYTFISEVIKPTFMSISKHFEKKFLSNNSLSCMFIYSFIIRHISVTCVFLWAHENLESNWDMLITMINWHWIYADRILIQIQISNTILKTPFPEYFILSIQSFLFHFFQWELYLQLETLHRSKRKTPFLTTARLFYWLNCF